MGTLDTKAWFESLLGHLDRHGRLAETVTSVLGYQSDVLAGGDRSGLSRLGVLAAWIRTLSEVSPAQVVQRDDSDTTHVYVRGLLADGTSAKVTVVLIGAESDLLAANVPIEDGASVPVELLLRLVDHELAEAVSR